jgi:hypothetical protein
MVEITPDFLHKYFISGVGSFYVNVPSSNADASLVFEGDPLRIEDRDLTFVRYLRYAFNGGGFLAFSPESAWEALGNTRSEWPINDIQYLTRRLLPI